MSILIYATGGFFERSEHDTDVIILQNAEEAAELKKKRQFRKFSYRGIDLDAYVLSLPDEPPKPNSIPSLEITGENCAQLHTIGDIVG